MKDRVHRFCQMTSIKGIPRLLRAKSFFMRFIWTISVVGFLCMAMAQVVVLTMEFRQYKTYTSIGEVFINVFDPDEAKFYSPDITLCNANPFTSNRNLSKDSTTLAEYFRLVERATACDETCTKDDGVALNHIREENFEYRWIFSLHRSPKCQTIGPFSRVLLCILCPGHGRCFEWISHSVFSHSQCNRDSTPNVF